MRLRDIIALGLLIVLAIGSRVYSNGDDSGGRRPDPRQFIPPPKVATTPATPRGAGRFLPPESYNDPRFIVEVGDKTGQSSGTAFSINGTGVWVTARHVTDGCDIVGLQKNNGGLVRVRRMAQQHNTDISLLWTQGGAPPMRVVTPQIRVGEDGYSFGFPRGEAGDVYGKVLGRGRMLARGRYQTEEPVVAWIQVTRVPDRGPNLSGISGGPWVNAQGEVIGVHVAGAPRRGRSYSTAPRSLLSAIRANGTGPESNTKTRRQQQTITPQAFPQFGAALRRQQSVAKVICLVGEHWRRMARERRS